MTVSANAEELSAPFPSVDDQATANLLRERLALEGNGATSLGLLDDDGNRTEVTLTPAVSRLLADLLGHISQGNAVMLFPVGKMLTTQQAADILTLSRPYVISLLDKGEIAFSLTGRHRRIRAEDLFAYKQARDAAREAALDELAQLDANQL